MSKDNNCQVEDTEFHESDDVHYCIKCKTTILGLGTYIAHRKSNCSNRPLEKHAVLEGTSDASIDRNVLYRDSNLSLNKKDQIKDFVPSLNSFDPSVPSAGKSLKYGPMDELPSSELDPFNLSRDQHSLFQYLKPSTSTQKESESYLPSQDDFAFQQPPHHGLNLFRQLDYTLPVTHSHEQKENIIGEDETIQDLTLNDDNSVIPSEVVQCKDDKITTTFNVLVPEEIPPGGISDSKNIEGNIRQIDFFSSLELTSTVNVCKPKGSCQENEPSEQCTDETTSETKVKDSFWFSSTDNPERYSQISRLISSPRRNSPRRRGKWLPGSANMVKKFHCNFCDRKFLTKSLLLKHKKTKQHIHVPGNNDTKIRPSREKKTKANKFLKETIQTLKGKRKVIVPVEPDSSALKIESQNIIVHKRLQSPNIDSEFEVSGLRINCPICRLSFGKSYMSNHLSSLAHIHNELEYSQNRNSATDHQFQQLILDNLPSVTAISIFRCINCKFYCNTKNDLKFHIKNIHKDYARPRNDPMVEVHLCSSCPEEKQLTSPVRLLQHLDSVEHQNNITDDILLARQVTINTMIRLICSYCFKQFKYYRSYNNHILTEHQETIPKLSIAGQRSLRCSECEFVAVGEQTIKKHISRVHHLRISDLYFCFICGKKFISSEMAVAHRQSLEHRDALEKEKGKKSERCCHFCYSTYNDLPSLKRHLILEHEDDITPCSFCGLLLPHRTDLSSHLIGCNRKILENVKGTYKCELCSYHSNLKAHVLMHITVSHGEQENKKYSCCVCKALLQSRLMKAHMLIHTNEWPHACKICSRKFPKADWLNSHTEKVHMNTLGGQKRCHLCPRCGKQFTTRSHLNRHNKNDHCGLIKSEPRSLPTIHKSHSSKFLCEICGEILPSNLFLKRHRTVHRIKNTSDNKKFYCQHCPYGAKEMHHLRRHLLVHEGSLPYKCPYCDYYVNNLENLRKHILKTSRHKGRFMYECRFCRLGNPIDIPSKFGTNFNSEFRDHLLKEHGLEFASKQEISEHIQAFFQVTGPLEASSIISKRRRYNVWRERNHK